MHVFSTLECERYVLFPGFHVAGRCVDPFWPLLRAVVACLLLNRITFTHAAYVPTRVIQHYVLGATNLDLCVSYQVNASEMYGSM